MFLTPPAYNAIGEIDDYALTESFDYLIDFNDKEYNEYHISSTIPSKVLNKLKALKNPVTSESQGNISDTKTISFQTENSRNTVKTIVLIISAIVVCCAAVTATVLIVKKRKKTASGENFKEERTEEN